MITQYSRVQLTLSEKEKEYEIGRASCRERV